MSPHRAVDRRIYTSTPLPPFFPVYYLFSGTLHRPFPAPYTEHAAPYPPKIHSAPHRPPDIPHSNIITAALSSPPFSHAALSVRSRLQPERAPRSRGISTRHGATVT
ncbi:hypothetical protein B0H11DRAFT_2224792 [Mycena galericulata]|nr:hypothetical protein B0H11DRAFT_2224792 [Mycena galericulata]